MYNRKELDKNLQKYKDVKTLILMLKNSGISENQPFRVKQLGNNITHSGALFMKLVNAEVLEIVEQKTEKVELNDITNYINPKNHVIITKEIYKDMNWYGQQKYEPYRVEKNIVESKYNIYAIQENWRNIIAKKLEKLETKIKGVIFNKSNIYSGYIQELIKLFDKSEIERHEIHK